LKATRQHYRYIADNFAPLVSSPIVIEQIADDLEKLNKKFNRKKFLARAIAKWEQKNLPPIIDDEIPY
jgi:hypothetical protein